MGCRGDTEENDVVKTDASLLIVRKALFDKNVVIFLFWLFRTSVQNLYLGIYTQPLVESCADLALMPTLHEFACELCILVLTMLHVQEHTHTHTLNHSLL